MLPSDIEKKYEINFPPEFGELVVMLIKKYQLGPVDPFTEPELLNSLRDAKTPEEKLKIFENLPLDKIIKIIKEIIIKEIPPASMSFLVQTHLGVTEKTANDLAQDIEKILPLVEKIPVEEKIVPGREPLSKIEVGVGKEGVEEKTKTGPYAPTERVSVAPKTVQKKDSYREVLEEENKEK